MQTDLQEIPGVGTVTELALVKMGYNSIESLIGEDPEFIYEMHCDIKGYQVDRCQLYVFRCAVYYAENEIHDPEKLKWWNWKDK
ncbi:pathogenicity locus Cdd1 protein [Orenia metallireducens]|uniref:Pathogenicity locus n=1 Tax=Orenia metallireducens TaxID=1413210 RepID=A0A285IGW5_9FIRM|nr:helix-hairpin-helix domain-containing protein [Orenia metallireducens]PRX17821.1 pathogenicity locus Cdd1 protein [Orenia metallireducens]SNY47202.1 Pathogenicity locus [Orenia metallireducens]